MRVESVPDLFLLICFISVHLFVVLSQMIYFVNILNNNILNGQTSIARLL